MIVVVIYNVSAFIVLVAKDNVFIVVEDVVIVVFEDKVGWFVIVFPYIPIQKDEHLRLSFKQIETTQL